MMVLGLESLEKVKQSKGGATGDLYLFISVDNHSIFKRSDEHLYFELPITFTDAALGTAVEVPSIDGEKPKLKFLQVLNMKAVKIKRQRNACSKRRWFW